MQAGRLDRRIIIQEDTPTQDTYGDETSTWSTFATVWANVKSKSGKEYFNSDQVVAERSRIFKIRYLPGVNEQMRISYDSNFYDIQTVSEIGRKEGMEIIATVNNPE